MKREVHKPDPLSPHGNGSRCTRCLSPVPLDDFLANDHLCSSCAEVPDSAYWEEIKQEQHTSRLRILDENKPKTDPAGR